jgi:hypothetical protein
MEIDDRVQGIRASMNGARSRVQFFGSSEKGARGMHKSRVAADDSAAGALHPRRAMPHVVDARFQRSDGTDHLLRPTLQPRVAQEVLCASTGLDPTAFCRRTVRDLGRK